MNSHKNGAEVYPKDVPPGPLWIVGKWMNKLLAACRSNAPWTRPGSGILIRTGKRGAEFSLEKLNLTHPLSVVIDNGRLRVVYGQVDGKTPGNFTAGDSKPLFFPTTTFPGSEFYVYCEVTRDPDTGERTTGDMQLAINLPTADEELGVAVIASVAWDSIRNSITIGQIAGGSLYCQYCGDEWLWNS